MNQTLIGSKVTMTAIVPLLASDSDQGLSCYHANARPKYSIYVSSHSHCLDTNTHTQPIVRWLGAGLCKLSLQAQK